MSILKFMKEIAKLKRIKRRGWIIAKIKEPESVADHSFSLSILSLLLAKDFNLNLEKCLKLALIHDICEVYTKDIVLWPKDKGTKKEEDKKLKEDKAFKRVIKFLPKNKRNELLKLWNELKENKTREARFILQLDKLEMIIQALIYKKFEKCNLNDWLEDADKTIKNRNLRKIFEEVKKEWK